MSEKLAFRGGTALHKLYLNPQPRYSEDIDIGFSEAYNLLLVCHCYKNSDRLIRIFSARKPTKHEEKLYGGNNDEQ